MATESAPASKRPSPVLLALLGLTVVAAVAIKLMGSASPGNPASNPSSPAAQVRQNASGKGGPIDRTQLDVHLEMLEAERPASTEIERNPFRFKPAPPPPPPPVVSRPPPPAELPPGPVAPPPPPPPPPITVKFIGVIDRA